MGNGCIGNYSVKESLSAMTAGTGLRPDPAAFFVVIDLPDTFIAHRPAVHGGAVVGWWGQKTLNILYK
jgi:hypothetical protein